MCSPAAARILNIGKNVSDRPRPLVRRYVHWRLEDPLRIAKRSTRNARTSAVGSPQNPESAVLENEMTCKHTATQPRGPSCSAAIPVLQIYCFNGYRNAGRRWRAPETPFRDGYLLLGAERRAAAAHRCRTAKYLRHSKPDGSTNCRHVQRHANMHELLWRTTFRALREDGYPPRRRLETHWHGAGHRNNPLAAISGLNANGIARGQEIC